MNCKKCGNLLGVNDAFCKNCGEPVSPTPTTVNAAPQEPVTPTNEVPNNDPNQMTSPMPEPIATPTNEVSNNDLNQVVSPAPEPEPVVTPTNEVPNSNLNQAVNPMPQPISPVNEQPPVANPAPVAQPTNVVPEKQKNNNLKIIIIILVVLVLAVGGFIAYKMLKPSNETPPVDEPPGGGSNVINNGENSGNTYDYKGFKFILPNGYTASAYNDEFIIKSQTAAAQIMIADYYTLDDIKPQVEALKAELIKQGVMVSSIENKTYAGKEWILMPATVTENGTTYRMTIAFTDLGEYHLARLYVITQNPNDETIYTEIVNMFSIIKVIFYFHKKVT